MKSLFSKTMAALLIGLLVSPAVQATPFIFLQQLLGMGTADVTIQGSGEPGGRFNNYYGYGPYGGGKPLSTDTLAEEAESSDLESQPFMRWRHRFD